MLFHDVLLMLPLVVELGFLLPRCNTQENAL